LIVYLIIVIQSRNQVTMLGTCHSIYQQESPKYQLGFF